MHDLSPPQPPQPARRSASSKSQTKSGRRLAWPARRPDWLRSRPDRRANKGSWPRSLRDAEWATSAPLLVPLLGSPFSYFWPLSSAFLPAAEPHSGRAPPIGPQICADSAVCIARRPARRRPICVDIFALRSSFAVRGRDTASRPVGRPDGRTWIGRRDAPTERRAFCAPAGERTCCAD